MPFPELPPLIAQALEAQGYAEPTPVQAAVLEEEALGRDLIVSAKTGSGKTVAFGLAMATRLLEVGGNGPPRAPLALVIAPTRELALQVNRELEWLFKPAGGKITTCVGGMNASEERRALSRGTHIVVGTPGRLRDHLERGALDLSALQYVVLDEADEMLDMGFREDLEEILDATPAERKTLLFSATMPKPIVALARRYQKDALRISTVGDDHGHGDISYQVVTVSPSEIEHAVINLLRFHEAATAMLFCATRDNVRHLHATLVERGFAAVALSGEHSQSERNHALQALRDGRARVCVATDVAARGIDIASLSLVVHVEVPRDGEVLQHRSGRTGRAGNKGTAVLIVPYPRRRRVEGMLRGARIAAEWVQVPTAEAIRAKDRERLLAELAVPVEASGDDRALAAQLVEAMTPTDLALALLAAKKGSMPEPEELIDISPRQPVGGGRGEPDLRGDPDDGPRDRSDFDDAAWYRMDIGRQHQADPRWILPLLCRRGHVSRNQIGAIRIMPTETWFQLARPAETKFRDAVKRTANPGSEDEAGIRIEPAPGPPPGNRRAPSHNERGEAQPPQTRTNQTYIKPAGNRMLSVKPGGAHPAAGRPASGKPPYKPRKKPAHQK
ncbi:MAG: DEAD/DEAH box helicase [Sphingomicrobium sp.]